MVSTTDLSFSYNNSTKFNFPDLQCRSGETLLITGGSGRGKTTLLHLLGGLLRADNGKVYIDSTDIESLAENERDHFRGQNIGMVLQQHHFIASLTVLENVVLASWLANENKAVHKATELLEHLDLKQEMHKLPARLSAGQQQRVTIARALINEPKLLLADEPTSSLDDDNAGNVANLLSNLSSEFGAALIVVTHDQRLKERFTNTIAL